ncbi:alpha/beta hydrolase [Vagococcus hydrophili]|uniref:Alpha/beta hydrolase n=1 Tax=Vagococcus hydrophili TaxID=2714947 RepID=A0A6G8ART0_9ENTE|nr:alpha/beta hydrolase [Vagococcus hydrophili]QIL47633.1 alpha/beta hydrolase [Vagococcus hydrophili]
MSVYEIGNGDQTLVFLSGGLTASPILDFKMLYDCLKDDFKIIVVEKFGYGFSSDTDMSRDIDVMLEETRELLKIKGIQSPYVLVPHSMSGIEALYWHQKYPEEVSAIIGLDMAMYEAYEMLKINLLGLKMNRLLIKVGLTKLFPKTVESDAVKYGNLNQIEKDIYNQLFHKNFTSKATLNEVKKIKENSLLIRDVNIENLPILVLVSNGKGTGIAKKRWLSIQQNLSKKSKYGKIIYYDCPHYIHNHQAKEISEEIKIFVRDKYC